MVVLAWALGSGAAWAQDASGPGRPLWEVGLAAGVGRVPDYPGADRSHTRGIVLPYAVYRGPVFRVDEGGVRGRVGWRTAVMPHQPLTRRRPVCGQRGTNWAARRPVRRPRP